MSETAGFTREELAAAASKQQRKLTVFGAVPVAPTKEEILAAIRSALAGAHGIYLDQARERAVSVVEKLFEERGL